MSNPIYVIETPESLSKDYCDQIKSGLRDQLGDPDAQVIILGRGLKLSVLRGDDAS